MSDSANLAIHFALKVLSIRSPNEAIEFLDHWDREEYDIILSKWPDVPKEVLTP